MTAHDDTNGFISGEAIGGQKQSGALVHRIAAFAFAFAMAIPRCQWRHRCVVTLGEFLVVWYSKPLWRKGKWKQRRKGDVRDVKHYHGSENREGHHSDDAVKGGHELRCEKIALCIAAFRVAALWCTKSGARNEATQSRVERTWAIKKAHFLAHCCEPKLQS